ncbi:MAG: hypothetical protein OXG24_09710 [Gammaproteobacteria bacterium]|nr:hypothetical protein [Gammaproteobacteria bacterium]
MSQTQITEDLAGYGGKMNERRQLLKSLCPCRNNQVKGVETWKGILKIATYGSLKERNSAAHAIGTLLAKAKKSDEWRRIVVEIEDELHALMDDTRASRSLLGTFKKHGHARRGTARKNYRKVIKSMDIQTPKQLAQWLNERLSHMNRPQVAASNPGLKRLYVWLDRRKTFEPHKRTKDKEVLAQAKQFLPAYFS